MVWCCGPIDVLSSEEGTNQGKNDKQTVTTNGKDVSPSQDISSRDDLVSVTVPEGMQAGQTITVMAPDGSRTVKASIPDGLGPGDSFLVRLAKPIRRDTRQIQKDSNSTQVAQPKFGSALETWLSPAAGETEPETITTPIHGNKGREREEAEADVVNPSFINTLTEIFKPSVEPTAPPTAKEATSTSTSESAPPSNPQETQAVQGSQSNLPNTQPAQTVDQSSIAPKNSSVQNEEAYRQPNQRLILVQVPPGLAAGQTMHVEVPGENRTLSVQIPPNVDTFHVSYTPRYQSPPLSPPSFVPNQNQILSRQQSPTGQKLLLVRVPPGTPAGTTLHVSVPDEPGRILAAQVPPGNVSEFHVSYEARPPGLRRGMLPPANPYVNSGYPGMQDPRNPQLQINTDVSGINNKQHAFNGNGAGIEQNDEQERRDEGDIAA